MSGGVAYALQQRKSRSNRLPDATEPRGTRVNRSKTGKGIVRWSWLVKTVVRRAIFLARWLYWRMKLGKRLRMQGFVFFQPGLRLWPLHDGRIELGPRVEIEQNVYIKSAGVVRIGADTFVGNGTTIGCAKSVIIGKDCLIGEYVSIRDNDHAFSATDRPIREQGATTAAVRIDDNVWLGAKVSIVAGVHIGTGSVVGANAVVTCDIPAGAVAVGIPARVIKQRHGM